MSMMKSLRSTDISPRTAVMSLVALALVTGGVMMLVIKMTHGGAGSPGVKPTRTATAQNTAAATTLAPVSKAPADYAIIAARNLFRVPAAPTEGQPAATTTTTTTVATAKPIFNLTPSKPTAPPRPSLACTGIVEVGGDTYALIEQLDQQLAQYTRVGGTAFDCSLVSIDARSVTMAYGGEQFTLALGDNKVDTPATPPAGAAPTGQPGTATAAGTAPRPTGPPVMDDAMREQFRAMRRRTQPQGEGTN